MRFVKTNYRFFLFFLIIVNIVFISWRAMQGSIIFHTDIARDFLVLHEMVQTHKPTLIGPRAGGIPGVFHGPLWFYVNLPVFLMSGGNPAATAWFWVFLSVLSIGIVYYVGKRMFDRDIALLASLLYSSFLISLSSVFTNSFGAVLCFPLFFYLFFRYTQTVRISYLLSVLFVLGLIVQFQVGFGVVLLFLAISYLVIFIVKKKKYIHFLCFLILLIPLSTFMLFEVRHNFLQTTSAIQYVATKASQQGAGEIPFWEVPLYRLKGAFLEGFGLTPNFVWFTLPVTAVFLWMLYKLKDKKLKYRSLYLLFFFFYFGFWVLTLAYKGIVWGYFYFAFLPVVVLIFSSFRAHLNKYLFLALYIYLLSLNMVWGVQNVTNPTLDWRLYVRRATDVFNDAGGRNFGYYVYSPDLYGYSTKYAILYVGKGFPTSKEEPFLKKNLTYLFIAPPPEDKPWLNENWWRESQVKIQKKPVEIYTYPYGFKTEKYLLTNKEITVPSDPDLIQDLTFR